MPAPDPRTPPDAILDALAEHPAVVALRTAFNAIGQLIDLIAPLDPLAGPPPATDAEDQPGAARICSCGACCNVRPAFSHLPPSPFCERLPTVTHPGWTTSPPSRPPTAQPRQPVADPTGAATPDSAERELGVSD